MTALEFIIWGSLTVILMKLNEKTIYEHIQDLKFEYNKFISRHEEPMFVVIE
jgi:hypothetical protein